MLERHRVDDVDGCVGRGLTTEEDTVDGLMGVLESMEDELRVGEVGESKEWACHALKTALVAGIAAIGASARLSAAGWLMLAFAALLGSRHFLLAAGLFVLPPPFVFMMIPREYFGIYVLFILDPVSRPIPENRSCGLAFLGGTPGQSDVSHVRRHRSRCDHDGHHSCQ